MKGEGKPETTVMLNAAIVDRQWWVQKVSARRFRCGLVQERLPYILAKFGRERTEMIHARLNAVGKEVGVSFSHGGNTGNTRLSHRLIYYAGLEGRQEEVVERVFKGYFEEERDICEVETLVKLGAEAGLEEGGVREWLSGEEGGEVVDAEVEEARVKGVRGVPNFEVNGRWVLGGAQEEGEFVKVFEEAERGE